MINEFKGISGISELLRQRQQQTLEDNILSHLEDIVDECRKHILVLYQKDEHLTGRALETELTKFISTKFRNLSVSDRTQIARTIKNELEGYGVLQDLLDDESITDVVVIRYDKVVYERNGQLHDAPENIKFRSEAHLRLFIERLCYLGRRKVDESTPTISLTTPEGYRVSITLSTIADGFSTLAIRRFVYVGDIDGLVKEGTYSKQSAEFLKRCVHGRRNIVFVGGMGTGKTTMLAVLAKEFGQRELPVLVEEVRECPMEHPNLRIFVARPPNIEGKGEIKFNMILKMALQSRATRILVAEVRDGAVYYMLTAMAMGQLGSMGTFHADNSKDAIHIRLPLMLGQAPECVGMGINSMYRIIGSAIHIVVMLGRDENGRRICTHISEVRKSNGEPPDVVDIFKRKGGDLVYTGATPTRTIEEMKQFNADLKGVI